MPLLEKRPVDLIVGGAGGQVPFFQMSLAQRALIEQVKVYCHDRIRKEPRAHLILYIDGVQRGRLDVKQAGSVLVYQPVVHGQILRFRSVHEADFRGDDETYIYWIEVWGIWAANALPEGAIPVANYKPFAETDATQIQEDTASRNA